jgi:hypothetical protein
VRQIIEGEYFAESVERLGGYRAVDLALETIIEALMQNPYGFPLIEKKTIGAKSAMRVRQ